MESNPQRRQSTESSGSDGDYETPEEADDRQESSDDGNDTFFDVAETTDEATVEEADTETKPCTEIRTETENSNKDVTQADANLPAKRWDTFGTKIDSAMQSDSISQALISTLQTLVPIYINTPASLEGTNRWITRDKWISVLFHALLAPNIKFNPETDRVRIYIWSEPNIVLNVIDATFVCVRSDAKNAAEVVSVANFKSQSTYGVVTYQYYVERKGITSKGTPRKPLWEEVYNKKRQNRRQLNFVIVKNFKVSFDQYDGFVYRPDKSVMKSSWSPWKTFKGLLLGTNKNEDAEIVTKAFGNSIVHVLLNNGEGTLSLVKAFNKTVNLVSFVEQTYEVKDRVMINTVLKNAYMNILEACIKSNQPSNALKRFKVAILLIKLRYRLGILATDKSDIRLICKGFLPTVEEEQTVSKEWEFLLQNSDVDYRLDLKSKLLTLAELICRGSIQEKNPVWLYLVPIIHYLEGTCKPHDEMSMNFNHNATKPTWWGLSEALEQIVKLFKGQVGRNWTMSLRDVIEDLQPIFKQDFLLPRTIMASLLFQETKDAIDTHRFPPEVCFAALYYYLKCCSKHEEDQLDRCLASLLDQVESSGNKKDKQQICVQIQISIDMLYEALRRSHLGIVSKSTKILLWLIAFMDPLFEDCGIPKELREGKFDLSVIIDKICEWIKTNKYSRETLPEYVKTWDYFFVPVNIPRTANINWWTECITKSLKNRVQAVLKTHKKTFPKTLVQTYCSEIDGCSQLFRDILTPIVCKVMVDTETIMSMKMHVQEQQVLLDLMSLTFVKECEKITKMHGNFGLNAILKWPSLPMFLNVLYRNKGIGKLNTQCEDKILLVETSVCFYVRLLQRGSIKVSELGLLHEHEAVFVALTELIRMQENVKELIETRTWELNRFMEIRADLLTLKAVCDAFDDVTVITEPIDTILQKDLDKSFLNELVIISDVSPTKRQGITVVSEQLKDHVLSMISKIGNLDDSICFRIQWKDIAALRLNKDSIISLEELHDNVYEPVVERLHEIEKGISTGSITFNEMEKLIGQYYEDNLEQMTCELTKVCLNTSGKTVRHRIEQYKHGKDIILSAEIAREIMDIQIIYGLSGDFQQIEKICSLDIQSLPLNEIKGDLIKTSKALCSFSKTKLTCLKKFAKCHELVLWLQESMSQDGLRELKVFVDLAMMSAGDDTEKVSRVQSLHAGVTGYSSLVFGLQQDSDYVQFINQCVPVFHELDNTPLLPEKLEHANRFLHWFKEIEQAHGAVEVTSFVQAEVINECGIYKIGTHVWDRPNDSDFNVFNSTVAELTEINQILKLTVLVDKSHEVPKEYTYDKLQDLQSRLMLVAGEAENSKRSVERFSLVLDGVVRLCNIYMKLVRSGCMLFQNFAIKLYCDTNPDRPVCAILEFENENIRQLKCRKTADEQLEDVMHKMASSMERYLTEWLDYVDSNRKKYPELNYFTINQLVILKREIAKINDNKEPTHLLYPILHDLKKNCKPDDVKEAHILATQELETQAEQKGKNEVAEPVETDKDSKENEFVQALIDAEYSRLVPFALQKFSPDFNISEGLCWCLENEENVEQKEAAQSETIIQETELGSVVPDSAKNLISIDAVILRAMDDSSQFDRCEAMLSKLNEIWNDFIQSISTNMKGFISLNHLGSLLRQLSCNDKNTIRRSLPPGFSDCSPNLIVCQKDDILYQALSLYLTDNDQPLPQADEILTCSASTTFEQVDIFLRRAFFNADGKIHCLMNADSMDLTLCESVEQKLQTFQRVAGKKAKYRLVIICDAESENKSIIISSLDKFRRATGSTNEEKLSSLLSSKLQMCAKEETAAVVDIQNSTVRVITSTRSGAGKTLYKIRRDEQLHKLTNSRGSMSISLPLQEKVINVNFVTGHLLPHVEEPYQEKCKIYHIDITNEVKVGIDYFLFNLLILGCLVDKSGYVWRKMQKDLYLIETMGLGYSTECQILALLPKVVCRTPNECLDVWNGRASDGYSESDQLFDEEEYESDTYQKAYSCLRSIDGERTADTSTRHCIETLIRHCGVSNPSWSEIHHFVKFLYRQLLDFEKNKNVFFSEAAQDILPGFSMFVQRCLLPMSRDFSSRSLNISEESSEHRNGDVKKELHNYQMKRTWESSPHPYLFFNEDGETFTFLGFNINAYGDLVDIETNAILERRIMSPDLCHALIANKVPIKEDFDKLLRKQKIERLCRVMGVDAHKEAVYDNTYELTTDNCKKIMAVYMRFRCGIPVIVMGETGCGKTRLVKFLCELMVPRDEKTHKPKARNMIIMKVHGGVSNEDIKSKVKEAETVAIENRKFREDMYTVLFFDEANTTESIGLIKEIMCDHTMEGRPLDICKNLKFVAACNPYRKHPDDLIKKLDKAGLGYHVASTHTKDRFGKIPMRHLVYRVQPLPQSLMAFVWDFGQLDSSVENLYIRQMVRRYMINGDMSASVVRKYGRLRYDEHLLDVISTILTASQDYMRNLKDECSFVSLRDVERTLQVMCWFYNKSKGKRTMFNLAEKKMPQRWKRITDETRSLILALGVCYHASLTTRNDYRRHIVKYFKEPCALAGDSDRFLAEIDCFEEVVLDSLELEENIARNQALKENVFMMVVCIELRIPLFLVGKPGSSKSLAKIIVTDAMQGRAAKSQMFKELKQVQMVSFQCSPHSTAAGIVSAFRQCANFQENYQENLDKFVSVVVLDEIGLAEDSQKMPLKALHPLLEDGCQGDEVPQEYMKVAFIGISNWSLDPAKMNRGLFVQRDVPDAKELQTTAKGICSSTKFLNDNLITPLASAYLKVFKKASEEKREFFGLRDFYSLMKMINTLVKRSKEHHYPTYRKLRFAVRRNFSGIETFDTFDIFRQEVKIVQDETAKPGDPDDSFSGLIKSWLMDEGESRHLLLLTENYSALPMFEQQFLSKASIKPFVIFGSSFRRDQEYTQVCRNINRIKLCMETGSLVILINSDNLYESLYDALNQYYVYFGGERYVDLGLGTHRVKCPVHRDFKLIVVAEKETVYRKFPIPLINRLEKHCLSSSTLLSEGQKFLADELSMWVENVTMESLSLRNKQVTENDIKKLFIGYHHDACSAVAHHMIKEETFKDEDLYSQAFSDSKEILLWCATPDAIVRVTSDRNEIQDIYFNKQAHDSISDYLMCQFKRRNCNRLYAQITTHSTLLTVSHKPALGEATGISPNRILLLEALSSYDTEQQFNSKIKEHIRRCGKEPSLLVVQCHSGDMNVNLIACAKYSILDVCASYPSVSLLIIVQLTPMETKCFQSLQCGEWHSAHIDNLYSSVVDMPRLLSMEGTPLSALLNEDWKS
ncbi:E3 ubiquitin-protein ligase RNF213-like [Mercenaria mercenaria]|uniref:E3 ubiquitin-protein ligase RNF213-like n=1 Tax=Mercenaria mercenaria TaxID=6596 RepID=UPI00234F24C0|nr:E3 ubiquitin-protein ligase RNF213-like [Mercenaria mercenaria]